MISFDKDTSLFAVYDGHGGHEVAVYCAQKLPDFLKGTQAYKKGDLENALIDTFLGFDATISTREVVTILKEIAGVKDDGGEGDGNSEDDENVDHLYEEASMPIEQVMEKYQSNLLNPHLKKLQGNKVPVSPLLKARKIGESSGQCSSSASSSGSCSSGSSKESSKTESEDTSADSTDKKDSEKKENNLCSSSACDSSSTGTSNGEAKIELTEIKSEEKSTAVEDDDKKSIFKDEKETTTKSVLTNGDAEPTKETTESLANGEITSSPKGKGKAIIKKSPDKTEPNHDKNLRIRNAVQLYSKLLMMDEESETEDENDETFQGAQQPSDTSGESGAESSSEGADDENEDENEEEEENGSDEEEEMPREEDDDDVTEFTRTMTEEPGSDSGCTAVVALLRGNQLYVANAGDSRCVVCRDGKAVDMSFDHKPEDKLEMNRVINAGGTVTRDGRVNGGLNLSRAIGDHAYKQNKKLSDREQMITALPDIKILTIDPAEDEFMVLACDGIWNFMSSQEVVDFVRPRLTSKTPEKLSQICEEMFDHCLAPNTMGDGTGCDNMTVCVIQFKNELVKKRSADNVAEEDENSAKRAKTETTEPASAE